MADFRSIAAVGKSLKSYLDAGFAEQQPVSEPGFLATAEVIQTEALKDLEAAHGQPVISLLLYRVDFDKTMRASWSAVGSIDGNVHLPLDLHYLATAWADNAEHEHLLIGRTMELIEEIGALSGPLLSPEAGWTANEAVQLCLEEVNTDDLMRTFESLACDFRLSIPYLARIVVLSTANGTATPDVLTHVQGLRPEAAGNGAGGAA
jgi:hypothetical protein